MHPYWQVVIEVWLTNKLIRSPLFNRGVRVVHKKVHELQHGKDPAELGGTNIDNVNRKGFLKYFMEEIKEQLRGNWSRSPPPTKNSSAKSLPPPKK